MFANVLIANRGEIACRIIRTARALGLRSLAIYAPTDRGALFTRMADEAHPIGPGDNAYLDGEQIVALASRLGAQCLHPGYGFLSENPDFAERCATAGVTFIGPSASAMRALGLKSAAKALMAAAGVAVVPGYFGEDQTAALLKAKAAEIGYPVLIKAIAGGGGRGMRRVDGAQDFDAQLASAKREAEGAFGDGRVLLEKYLAKSRHIEIQVFGDSFGNAIHLGERDCSLQRRRQKVIEESPAPGLPAAMRASIGAAAVRAARAAGYVSAGTVEFIADVTDGYREDRFYFMEMNVRLQVEHPVTEMTTGLDLVAWQFQIAAGDRLPLLQNELRLRGCAIEARLYAEDPGAGFLPSPGRIVALRLPASEDVRIDSGVEAGDEVSPAYDSMIAKIIVRAAERPQALARMRAALAACMVIGPKTNLSFLNALCSARQVEDGLADTQFIDENLERLAAAPSLPSPKALLAGARVLYDRTRLANAAVGQLDPWSLADSFELAGPRRGGFEVALERRRIAIATLDEKAGTTFIYENAQLEPGEAAPPDVAIYESPAAVFLFVNGQQFNLSVADFETGRGPTAQSANRVEAPMPGRVLAVLVKPGDRVEQGAPLAILEAMKMEHSLQAPNAGRIGEILVAAGAQVSLGELLMRIEPEGHPQT